MFVFVFGPENCIGYTLKFYRSQDSKSDKLVTSYGNVKSEIQIRLVFIVVGLHQDMYVNNGDAQSNINHLILATTCTL